MSQRFGQRESDTELRETDHGSYRFAALSAVITWHWISGYYVAEPINVLEKRHELSAYGTPHLWSVRGVSEDKCVSSRCESRCCMSTAFA